MKFNQFLSGIPANDYVYQERPYEEQIIEAAELIEKADSILIGAGAGISTAAGLNYGGRRFTDHFQEFIDRYGEKYMTDMYAAAFYPFPTEEERWGYWSKHAYMNRIKPGPLPLYNKLYNLVKEKEYFILTTNADHQFYKAGCGEDKIFATQGDYGLIQCMRGCHPKTYNAIPMFLKMNQMRKDCKVPSSIVPKCPVCGGKMTMNLRCDQYFVEDKDWEKMDRAFDEFLSVHLNRNLLLLELGVGFNTPSIIRFPFENLLKQYNNLKMIRLNLDQAFIPQSIEKRTIGINKDMMQSISDIEKSIALERGCK